MREEEMRIKLQHAIDHRLSSLEGDPWLAQRIIQAEKGEEHVMKKKISVSIALVLALMLLTLSAAVALVHSTIADYLYGSQEEIPPVVLEGIHTPAATVETSLGVLSLDEWLYDGTSLHTVFSMANPTEEPLLYTLDGIWLNDQHVTYDHIVTEGAGDNGFMLGGAVDGAVMPASKAIYNQATQVYHYDENGRYQGREALPEGAGKLRVSVAVWRPINQVELLDYNRYEGNDVTETKDHLTVDAKGCCSLWMFRPEAYNLNVTADKRSSQVYREAYQALGWAELVDTLTVEVDVLLDKEQIARKMPEKMEYLQGDCRVELTRFDMSLAGGVVEGLIIGEKEKAMALILGKSQGGWMLVDKEGQRAVSNGMYWEETAEGMKFHMNLAPMTGELPEVVYLAHFVADNPRWDENEALYDPTVEKPENVIGRYQLDYTNEIRIELK